MARGNWRNWNARGGAESVRRVWRTCPRCGYGWMSKAKQPKCPECGTAIPVPSFMRRESPS